MEPQLRKYTIDDLEEIAQNATSALSAFSGQELNLAWPPVNDKHQGWDLRDWEIDWFVRAYRDYSLFELKPRRGRPSKKWPLGCSRVDIADGIMDLGRDGQSLGHEFIVIWPFTRVFSQEYLMQFSIAGELVGLYGQPSDRLVAEKDHYAIDLAVFDGEGNPVIAVEAKVAKDKHDALIRGIKKCRGKGLSKDTCPAGGDYRKCYWIRQNPTVKYTWVRSQDKSDLFSVQRDVEGTDYSLFDLDQIADPDIRGILSRHDWA